MKLNTGPIFIEVLVKKVVLSNTSGAMELFPVLVVYAKCVTKELKQWAMGIINVM